MPSIILQEPHILLILDLLDRASLNNFRLCSSHWRAASDAVFYRELALRNQITWDEDIEDGNAHIARILQRLFDPDDRIRFHVRHLQIGPFEGGKWPRVLRPNDVLQVLQALSNLTDFQWHCGYNMPSAILQTVHDKWPHCRIHIKQDYRLEKALDLDLLSSPQLVTLVIPLWEVSGLEPYQSEWPAITKLVKRQKSLKSFQPFVGHILNKRPVPVCEYPSVGPGSRRRLHLVPDISWSFLNHLGVGVWSGPLFRAITGLVPQLRSLTLNCTHIRYHGEDGDAFEPFLRSVNFLETISLSSSDRWSVESALTALFETGHGSYLRDFTLDGPLKPREQIQQLKTLSSLQFLSLTFTFASYGNNEEAQTIGPIEALSDAILDVKSLIKQPGSMLELAKIRFSSRDAKTRWVLRISPGTDGEEPSVRCRQKAIPNPPMRP
ncbi:hypothetical protein BT63DRAFT_415385 [Microthyrium microscopicum]|uniref:F-box domain-containing protein n=1 Tax=Microthyrium microscopicum TaxID=703497 RepID=A0A6A6U6H4_9PEZI|nr:hypothetical protein BT63DRAFT_415385 [Microthyrium microscopicum]